MNPVNLNQFRQLKRTPLKHRYCINTAGICGGRIPLIQSGVYTQTSYNFSPEIKFRNGSSRLENFSPSLIYGCQMEEGKTSKPARKKLLSTFPFPSSSLFLTQPYKATMSTAHSRGEFLLAFGFRLGIYLKCN